MTPIASTPEELEWEMRWREQLENCYCPMPLLDRVYGGQKQCRLCLRFPPSKR